MKLSHMFVLLTSLSLVSVVLIQHAKGQCRGNEGAKLNAADFDKGDFFGFSVSVSGDVAVFGAHGDNPGGAAYAYRFNGSSWVQEQKLTATDGATNNFYGSSVCVDGDVILVGAYRDDDAASNAGAAYVYRFNGSTWVEEQKLTASDGAPNDNFGRSVSLSGGVAVLGAPMDDDFGMNAGSVYVYRFDGNTWIEEQELIQPDGGTPCDYFGGAVSVSGDAILVGSRYHNHSGFSTGAAYVFRFNGSIWLAEVQLTASDAQVIDAFGESVAIDGDVAVVGAIWDDDACPEAISCNSGAVYMYRFDGDSWGDEQKLTASDGTAGVEFGKTVSIDGDVVVVGAYMDDGSESSSGSAYLYRFDGWTWVDEQKLTASDATETAWFGHSVSVSDDMVVVGAYQDDLVAFHAGSVYAFGIKPITSEPQCGAIDARQPSAPDGSDPAGWDSITMTFDEPPGEMNAEDFAVVISPPGSGPVVTDVTMDGNTATVHFDGFIPTQAWTTITHWPTGAATSIGCLPADVDNNTLSNANDVLFLIDVLNGVIDPAPPAYQTDTDRSGATNANDVLRVIDLLNGAGAYDEYLNAKLPA
ncbi:MAG: hypothetical protein IID36_08535 [Planctomycetes bacterium]|nr:hypothetical protein [Planctomycetota bacterium]